MFFPFFFFMTLSSFDMIDDYLVQQFIPSFLVAKVSIVKFFSTSSFGRVNLIWIVGLCGSSPQMSGVS